MTCREAIDRLQSEGFNVRQYVVEYLIRHGVVERPQLDASGRRNYTERNLEQIRAQLRARKQSNLAQAS